ncbi:MAG: hypothetical protein MJK10_00035 [Pseudomonadales bacterium]|nr:hypothetical protein [Pseudomonadales bacterium]NRA14267.1 hypothetical protein [Oceanospirillaceae bacterium]
MKNFTLASCILSTSIALSAQVAAHSEHTGGIKAPKFDSGSTTHPSFDIIHSKISTQGNIATFHLAITAEAGSSKPKATGKLAGSSVYSYVWPTNLDPSTVGFEEKTGILALAVTAHPDFDDTPLYDENNDGELSNDGNEWHSHWIVLAPNEQCGPGALAVVDIPKGAQPKLPKTWPGLPILLDSPGWNPTFHGNHLEVKVPFADINSFENITYDGVTAALRVNQSVHAPLLCVTDVLDIASGDLSLPGKVNQ